MKKHDLLLQKNDLWPVYSDSYWDAFDTLVNKQSRQANL